jgi:antitoxin FitA
VHGQGVASNMCTTCTSVMRMSKMIQVRNVPDDVHRTLKTRAAAAGMSLSDYIKRELEAAATQATLEEIDARVRRRGRSNLSTETIVALLRETRGE